MSVDLSVELIRSEPAEPAPGDRVTFSVNVANRGTEANASWVPVWFSVDTVLLAAGYVPPGLAAGGKTTVVGDRRPLIGPPVVIRGLDGRDYRITPGDPNYPDPDEQRPVTIVGLDGKHHTITHGDPNYPRYV